MKKKSLTYPAIFMLILAFLLTFFLALLSHLTAPVVAYQQEVALQSKILYVFQIKVKGDDDKAITKAFNDNVKEENFNGEKLFTYVKNGNILAYAVPFEGPGLWGSINGYVGISSDLKTILGIDFIKQEETPGLGGRIVEPFYKNQFINLDISKANKGNYLINRPAQGGNVDAIAGASLTSNFVVKMVNEDLSRFMSAKGGQ